MPYFDHPFLSHQEKKQNRANKTYYIDRLNNNTKKDNKQVIKDLKKGKIPHLNFSTRMTTPLLTCIQVDNLDFLKQYYHNFNQLPDPKTPLVDDKTVDYPTQIDNDMVLNLLLNKNELNSTSHFYLKYLDKQQHCFTLDEIYPAHLDYRTSPNLFEFYQTTQKYGIRWDIQDLLEVDYQKSANKKHSLRFCYINNFFDYVTVDNQYEMESFFRQQFVQQETQAFLDLGLAQSIKLENTESIQDFCHFIQNHFDYLHPEEAIQDKKEILDFIQMTAQQYHIVFNNGMGLYSIPLNCASIDPSVLDSNCFRVFDFVQNQYSSYTLNQIFKEAKNNHQQDQLNSNVYDRIHNILLKIQNPNNKNHLKQPL